MAPPTVFVSYAWEHDEHSEWVKRVAARLRADGVNVLLDRWHVPPGGDLTAFMEQSVSKSSFVLLVCTPAYKLKADERAGGVGYEGAIISGAILTGTPQAKFVPLLRGASWKESGPARLLGSRYLDFRGEPYSEKEYEELLRAIHGMSESAPPIGLTPPAFSSSKFGDPRSTRLLAAAQAPGEALAKTIAEALAFARDTGDADLAKFCEQELAGLQPGTLDKRDPDFPHHRLYTAYVGLGQHINSSAFMWDGDPEKVFQYLNAHPEEFPQRKLLETKTIAALEEEARRITPKTIGVIQMRAGDVAPDFAKPELPVFAHVRSDTPAKIVQATRGELTRRLLRISK